MTRLHFILGALQRMLVHSLMQFEDQHLVGHAELFQPCIHNYSAWHSVCCQAMMFVLCEGNG